MKQLRKSELFIYAKNLMKCQYDKIAEMITRVCVETGNGVGTADRQVLAFSERETGVGRCGTRMRIGEFE